MAPKRIVSPGKVRMSDQGYWIVDVNLYPGMTCSVMIAVTGISPDEARQLASHVLTAPASEAIT